MSKAVGLEKLEFGENITEAGYHRLIRLTAGMLSGKLRTQDLAVLAEVAEVVKASEKNSFSGRRRSVVKSLWAASTIAGVPHA